MWSRQQLWFAIALGVAFGFSPTAQAIDGDFNGDGLWDCIDLNTLSQAIASGSVDQLYDLNGDGLLSFLDVADESAGWLAIAGPQNPQQTGGRSFALGDANLDGLVDGSDFSDWNANKFSALSLYCSGDFNVDGMIDETDWQIWNAHKFTSSAAKFPTQSTLVPEPTISGGVLLLIASALMVAVRSANSRRLL